MEVVFHPYTLLNNQLFIESGWKYVMNNEEAQDFGLQLWVKDDGNGGRFFLDGGNNSLQMLVDWV